MTDLNQFDFITYYSTQRSMIDFIKFNIDCNEHNFVLTKKFRDNSGGYIICEKCKIKGIVEKISHLEYKFSSLYRLFKNLSCDELVIKNLLE